MSIRPDMIGIVVEDLDRSLHFYRLLGLEAPSPKSGEDYVEVTTPNGYRISWNALSMVKQIEPGVGRSGRPQVGARVPLRLARGGRRDLCEARGRGVQGAQGSVGRVLGSALRHRPGSGRQSRQPVRAAAGQGVMRGPGA